MLKFNLKKRVKAMAKTKQTAGWPSKKTGHKSGKGRDNDL